MEKFNTTTPEIHYLLDIVSNVLKLDLKEKYLTKEKKAFIHITDLTTFGNFRFLDYTRLQEMAFHRC